MSHVFSVPNRSTLSVHCPRRCLTVRALMSEGLLASFSPFIIIPCSAVGLALLSYLFVTPSLLWGKLKFALLHAHTTELNWVAQRYLLVDGFTLNPWPLKDMVLPRCRPTRCPPVACFPFKCRMTFPHISGFPYILPQRTETVWKNECPSGSSSHHPHLHSTNPPGLSPSLSSCSRT